MGLGLGLGLGVGSYLREVGADDGPGGCAIEACVEGVLRELDECAPSEGWGWG